MPDAVPTAGRRVCVVTGTRAEYGLMHHLINAINDANDLTLQLVVTGMHLSPEFGLTYRQIESDGHRIDRKVEMLLSADTPSAITKSTGLGMIGLADAMAELSPDLMVILGDRFEILAAAVAAMHARVPIAHLHGGETTEGATDEGIRHAVTKLSHLHFVAAEEYRRRVIQLGESPDRVFHVGGLGVDAIARTERLSRGDLSNQLGLDLSGRYLLVAYHPVTLEQETAADQFDELTEALESLPADFRFVITEPNADADGRVIIERIAAFVARHPERAASFQSLGRVRYWSAMEFCAAVVGNSSSGLLEAPTFGIPTVDIGDRQRGRLRADSVLGCPPDRKSIADALDRALSDEFKRHCGDVTNPYGRPDTVGRILTVLRETVLNEALLKKHFHDLPLGGSTVNP